MVMYSYLSYKRTIRLRDYIIDCLTDYKLDLDQWLNSNCQTILTADDFVCFLVGNLNAEFLPLTLLPRTANLESVAVPLQWP